MHILFFEHENILYFKKNHILHFSKLYQRSITRLKMIQSNNTNYPFIIWNRDHKPVYLVLLFVCNKVLLYILYSWRGQKFIFVLYMKSSEHKTSIKLNYFIGLAFPFHSVSLVWLSSFYVRDLFQRDKLLIHFY